MDIWIGLAHVEPCEGNNLLKGGCGVFVPVVGLASDADDLAMLTATLLQHHQFKVIKLDDIELLSTRANRHAVESDMLSIAECLTENNRIGIGAIEVYHSNQT